MILRNFHSWRIFELHSHSAWWSLSRNPWPVAAAAHFLIFHGGNFWAMKPCVLCPIWLHIGVCKNCALRPFWCLIFLFKQFVAHKSTFNNKNQTKQIYGANIKSVMLWWDLPKKAHLLEPSRLFPSSRVSHIIQLRQELVSPADDVIFHSWGWVPSHHLRSQTVVIAHC